MQKKFLIKKTFSIIFISILFIIPKINSFEQCWNSSMSQTIFNITNLKTHGFGAKVQLTSNPKLYLHSKTYYEWKSKSDDTTCGFIFKEPIDFRKDVHIYLENNLIFNGLDLNRAFDGFTIVIGKDKNYIVNEQKGEHLGYNDMTNIFVTEIDTHYNENGDLIDDHLGFRNCFENPCRSAFDSTKDKQESIYPIYNNYNANIYKNYKYRIHLLYSYENAKVSVKLESIDKADFLSFDIDLTKYLDNGIGYIAFSTFLRGYRRTENIYGSFVCNGISHSLTPVISISIDNKIVENVSNGFKIGVNNYYNIILTYQTKRDLTYDNIYIDVNSDTIEKFSLSKDDTEKTYIVKAFKNPGNYTLIAKSAHETQTINYQIISDIPDYFVVYGKNLKEFGNAYYEKNGNTFTLKWGTLKPIYKIGGDFSYGDFVGNKTFSFIIQAFDENNNEINNNKILESSAIIQLLQISISNTKNEYIPLYIKKIKENSGLYEISFNINSASTYIITGGKGIQTTIKINVINYLPSPKSYCNIESNKNEFIQNEIIKYSCILINDDNIKLNPVNIFDIKQTNFNSKLIGNNKTINLNIENNNDTIYSTYTSTISGNFEFKIEYCNNNSTCNEIYSMKNKFDVYTIPMDISFVSLFDYDTEKWYSNDKIKDMVFKYDSTNNFYYLLQLYESDKTTPYINIKNYKQIDLANLNGKLMNVHNSDLQVEKQCSLQFDIYTEENKSYIKMTLGSTSCLISSSYNYEFDINYLNTNLKINLKYLLSDNEKTYCQHDISESNTYFEVNEDIKNTKITVGQNIEIGAIYLKTICNRYYDNYLNNINDFSYTITSNKDIDPSTKITIVKDDIRGKYKVYFQSTISNNYKYNLMLNKIEIDNGSNEITYNAEPIAFNYEHSLNNNYSDEEKNILNDVNSDEPFIIYFKAFDKYSNQLYYDIKDYKETQLSMTLKVFINDEDLTSNYKDKMSIEYDKNKKEYYIKDNILDKNGKFEFCLISNNKEKNLTYTFTKLPGVVSKNTIISIINEYQIQVGESSTISVNMYDKNKNIIGKYDEIYENEIKKLSFYAVNENNLDNRIEYTYKERQGINAIFISSSEIFETGLYTVKGLINEVEEITICSELTGCEFNVVENNFNMNDSILYRLSGSNKIKMNENDYYIINKNYENLIFYFEFYNKNGQIVEYVDQNRTDIKAILTNVNNNNEKYEMENKFISNNGILFKYNFNNKISNENYNLTLYYNEKAYNNYNIKIINEETSANDFNIDKTYINNEKMFLIAGEYSYIYFELRDNNSNPYLTNDFDISKFSIKSINSTENLISKFHKGSKLGTFILEIKDDNQSSYTNPNIIQLLYEGTQFRSIDLIVNENIIYKFKISENCIKNEKEKTLNDGEVNKNYLINMVPYDKFGNVIKKFLFDENIFQSEFIKNFFNIKSNYSINLISSSINTANNSITLIINTKYSDDIILSSSFLDEEYTIKINGNNNEINVKNKKESESNIISFENSYLILDNVNPSLGETVDLYVFLYDSDNNYINANNLDSSEINLIKLYHRYYNYNEENDLIPSNYDLISNKNIVEKNGIYVVKYSFEINKIGINNFIAFYDFSPIVCKNTVINVDNENNNLFSFENSVLFKFDNDKDKFELLLDDSNYISYNYKETLLIKFIPKDIYNNNIKINEDMKKLIEEKITFNFNENLSFEKYYFDNYLILIFSDYENYKNLEGNIYSLNIEYENNKKIFKINLSGPKTNEYFTKNNLNVQNTLISYEKLNILAGNYGFISIDFRTDNNFHYLGTDFENIKITIENCNTNYMIYNDNSYPYLILITSNKSNTFPTKNDCLLKTLINDKKSLNSSISISNNRIKYAKINDKYIEMDSKLKEGNSDYYYNFSVKSYDEFDNEAKNSNNKLKINIVNENDINSYFKYNYINIFDGETYYIYDLTKKGNYFISAGKNSLTGKENLFSKNYDLFINNGEVSNVFTTVEVDKEIVAGNILTMRINIKDKNSNSIPVSKEILSNFEVYATINEERFNVSESKIENNNLIFNANLTKKGENFWTIKYKSKILFQNIQITKVIPNNFNSHNTLIYYYNESHNLTLYEDENIPIYSSKDSPLEIHLTFRDDYNNTIDTITDNTKINSSSLEGNNMKKIIFEDNINTSKNKIIISLKDEDKTRFNHLVQRENYNFILGILDEINENNYKIFNLTVFHHTNTDDREYGNGIYDVSKTEFEYNSISFKTDDQFEMKFTLKTSENLIYNDFIDKSYININLSNIEDKTFGYEISQDKRYGIYIIKFSSHLVQNISVNLQIKNIETGITENTNKIDIRVTVGIPSQKFNIYSTNIPEISTTEKYNLYLKLYDQYENEYKNYDLELIRDKIKLQFNSQIFDKNLYETEILDGQFVFYFTPAIPPRNNSINAIYVENGQKILRDDIKTYVDTPIDFSKTKIEGDNYLIMNANDTLILYLTFYDENGICVETLDEKILRANIKTISATKDFENNYIFERKDSDDVNCKYYYQLKMDENNKYVFAGFYNVSLYANETYINSFIQKVNSGNPFSFKANYVKNKNVFNENNIEAGSVFYINIDGYDSFKNKVTKSIDKISAVILNTKNEKISNYSIKFQEEKIGSMKMETTIFVSGEFHFQFSFDGQNIDIPFSNGANKLSVFPSYCINHANNSENKYIDYSKLNIIGENNIITIYCYDQYDNKILKGGSEFETTILMQLENGNVETKIESNIVDNNDGSYTITFKPPMEAKYIITTYINVLNSKTIYDNYEINLMQFKCDENNEIKCPNKNKCVPKNEIQKCINEDNECTDLKKPFKCKTSESENAICVESQTDCECPEGYTKCEYMNNCVKNEDNCPFFLELDCDNKNYPVLCDDGICRNDKMNQPSKRRCPIGYVLCPDLSCQSSYENCKEFEYCGDDMITCADNSCVSDQSLCPTSITCSNRNYVVCPDGKCVENEMYCNKVKECGGDTPYLCNNNECAKDEKSCKMGIVCGHGKSLCEDFICRENC